MRIFKATDDLESCQKFMEGHMKILKVFGITMITSASTDWFHDPSTYVIVVESKENNKVLGGARLHISGGLNKLPIETAVCEMDVNIGTIIKKYRTEGTAELCGLWNSREIAGLGIGSIYLTRAAVAVAPSLNLKTLWALCAPYTIEMAKKAGFEIAKFVGNEGTFYYPKDDLLATAMVLENTSTLNTADKNEFIETISLRTNPLQIRDETGRKGVKFQIKFNLTIEKPQ